jgi:hypothetical protein
MLEVRDIRNMGKAERSMELERVGEVRGAEV